MIWKELAAWREMHYWRARYFAIETRVFVATNSNLIAGAVEPFAEKTLPAFGMRVIGGVGGCDSGLISRFGRVVSHLKGGSKC